MPYNFDKLKLMLKNKGFTLIDYTNKIKTEDDMEKIEKKIDDKKYDKTVILWDNWIVGKKVKGDYVINILKNGQNLNSIHLINKKYFISIDKDMDISGAVIDSFLNNQGEVECQVCFNTVEFGDVMPCPNCVFDCCKECFLKNFEKGLKDGKVKVKCFGCRTQILNLPF
jgi:hypothetical protein